MADAITEAIAKAKEAAAATPTSAPSAAVVPFKPQAGPVTTLSAAEMMQGSFNVDAFIKVSEDGIKVGEKPGLITDPLRVAIDLSEVFYYFGVKYGDKPVVYEKTTNRVNSLTGKPWNDVLAMGARVDGAKFKGEYRSGDVPMVLLADAKDIKGNLIEAAGARLGKSLSTTEWKEWEALLRTVVKQGMSPETEAIEVEVGFKQRKNNSGQTWGVLTFKVLGAYSAEQAA